MEQKVREWGPTTRTLATSLTSLGTTIALLLIAEGCGSEGNSKVTLPSTTPPTASSSGAASPTSPTRAVIAAYTALFPTADKAIASPPEQARAILQVYVTGDYLNWEIRQVMNHQAEHQEPWGKVVVHVTKVDLKVNTAKIHDCQDASNAGLADSRTHMLIPKTRGTANRNLIADMIRGSDGRWRVTGLRQYDSPCRVSSSPQP